jgi:hypothetical protein
MAKQPATDAIMAADKLKPMLALSKREPVNAAIGMTADGDGFILLDKKAKPKTVVSMLKSTAAKAKLQLNPSSIRYGRAEVDTDYDAGMVRFFINKEAPGVLRVKLVEVVKRIAYQKVELNVDPAIDAEPETEEEGEEGQTIATAPDPEPIPEAPPLPTPGLDTATLRRSLAGMIGRINQTAGDDATRKTSLMQLAGAANEALKGTDLASAAAAIDRLREALDAPGSGSTPGSAPGSTQETTGDNGKAAAFRAVWTTAWESWIGAIDTVEAQIDVLGRVLHASGDEGLQNIADSGLATIFDNHKVRLTGAGMRLRGATDAALEKCVTEARAAIDALNSHIASSPKVAVCDEINLGVAVAIRGTLTPALQRLSDALSDAPKLAEAA